MNRSKRGVFFSRLEGCGGLGAPNVRDDLLECSTARAKATRSGNSLRLEVQWTSNASFASERL